jgi:trk system potassium uptake protein TrkA
MKFAVIGYGSFGSNMAKTLFAKGHEVLVIDKDRERVAAAKDFATNAVMTDSAVKENLEALGLRDMDVVVVSMGHEMEASVLTTLYLRELGAKRILTKALSEDHAKVLEAVGATEVVYPEKDMAVRTALRLSSPNILEYLPLSHGITIQEIAPPNRYGVQVVAVKEIISDHVVVIPRADFVVKDSDILVLIGEEEQLGKI